METITGRRNRPARLLGGFLSHDPLEDFTLSDTGLRIPAINISENDRQWNIEVGAPGLCSENYKIDVANDVLHIEATKQMNVPDEERNYSHQEFRFKEFNKSFSLPAGADVSNISASCKDGLLDVIIPKKDEYKQRHPRKIAVS